MPNIDPSAAMYWFSGGWFIELLSAWVQALDNVKKDHQHLHGRIIPHR